ncbi:MAG: hypothetical protein L0Y71_12150 [Gemmataceae bacterium]|nr:hypothetical protein [Gemmataceae bacterium]
MDALAANHGPLGAPSGASVPADAVPTGAGSTDAVAAGALRDLEGRVQSLESAVVRLEDTQALEERVAARVVERLPQVKVAAGRDASRPDRAPERTGSESAADVAALDVAVMEERIWARLAERLPPQSAKSAVESKPRADAARADAARADAAAPRTRWGGAWSSWLLIEMFREAKLLVRMIFDHRYHMAWTTRIIALILFPAIVLAHWWVPLLFFWFPPIWFNVTREVCVNLVNLALAFALFKALNRETRRYQEKLQ